jgi:ankyrin repeat protein
LIEQKQVNVFACNVEGKTALHFASEYGRHELCEILYNNYPQKIDFFTKDYNGFYLKKKLFVIIIIIIFIIILTLWYY